MKYYWCTHYLVGLFVFTYCCTVVEIRHLVWDWCPAEQSDVSRKSSALAGYVLAETVLDTLCANNFAIMLSSPAISHSRWSKHVEVYGHRVAIQCD